MTLLLTQPWWEVIQGQFYSMGFSGSWVSLRLNYVRIAAVLLRKGLLSLTHRQSQFQTGSPKNISRNTNMPQTETHCERNVVWCTNTQPHPLGQQLSGVVHLECHWWMCFCDKHAANLLKTAASQSNCDCGHKHKLLLNVCLKPMFIIWQCNTVS